jgi:hypothetical protein
MAADFIVLEPGMRPYDDAEPALSAIFDYWAGKCRGAEPPIRRDLDMIDIPAKVLPLLMLFDVDTKSGRMRFRYRLIGTTVTQYIGHDHTGRFLDEVIPADRAAVVVPSLEAAVKTGKANTLEASFAFPNRDFNYVRRLVMPLSSEGTKSDMLMTCFVFKARPEAA